MLDAAKKSGDTKETVNKILAQTNDTRKITITSLKARISGSDIIVRVEYTFETKSSSDGNNIRYFVMENQTVGKWRIKQETSALWYYATLW